MPELAQLMSDMWEEHLGVKSTVEVSDGARTRELWWGREIDGDWHVRPNEIEWDGGGGASALYGQLDNDVRLSEDPELRALVQEGLAVVDPALRHDAYHKMWTAIREEHYMSSLGILKPPMGGGSANRRLGTLAHDSIQQRLPHHYPQIRRGTEAALQQRFLPVPPRVNQPWAAGRHLSSKRHLRKVCDTTNAGPTSIPSEWARVRTTENPGPKGPVTVPGGF